jgi:hypothetical protein
MERVLRVCVVQVVVAVLGCAVLIGCGGSSAAGPGSDGGDGSTGADGGNPPGSKRIFVTATAYSGNLAGSAGADTICTAAAEAVSLGGRWTSWISTATSDAFSRVQEVGPWYLLNGTMAFTNKANFRTMPLAPINVTESGTTPSGRVWTGTVSGGIHSEMDCQGFSTADASVQGTVGSSPSTQNWTDNASPASCQSTGSIYCIEQ